MATLGTPRNDPKRRWGPAGWSEGALPCRGAWAIQDISGWVGDCSLHGGGARNPGGRRGGACDRCFVRARDTPPPSSPRGRQKRSRRPPGVSGAPPGPGRRGEAAGTLHTPRRGAASASGAGGRFRGCPCGARTPPSLARQRQGRRRRAPRRVVSCQRGRRASSLPLPAPLAGGSRGQDVALRPGPDPRLPLRGGHPAGAAPGSGGRLAAAPRPEEGGRAEGAERDWGGLGGAGDDARWAPSGPPTVLRLGGWKAASPPSDPSPPR